MVLIENSGKLERKSVNYVHIIKQRAFACARHRSYFCPAAELQCAVAATELSITQLLERQSARFVKLLLRQLNGARAQLHHTTVELPSLFSLLFESPIKELQFHVEPEAVSLSPQRFCEIQESSVGCVTVFQELLGTWGPAHE